MNYVFAIFTTLTLIGGICLSGKVADNKSSFALSNEDKIIQEDKITALELGSQYSGVVINDGINDHLFTWGSNINGGLGLGDNIDYSTPQEILDWDGDNANGNQSLSELYPLGYEITSLSLGGVHGGVIVNDGTNDHLYMWGKNASGDLGIGNNTLYYNSPQEVLDWDGDSTNGTQTSLEDLYPEGYNITDLSLGGTQSSVIVNDGTNNHLYMWGGNNSGGT